MTLPLIRLGRYYFLLLRREEFGLDPFPSCAHRHMLCNRRKKTKTSSVDSLELLIYFPLIPFALSSDPPYIHTLCFSLHTHNPLSIISISLPASLSRIIMSHLLKFHCTLSLNVFVGSGCLWTILIIIIKCHFVLLCFLRAEDSLRGTHSTPFLSEPSEVFFFLPSVRFWALWLPYPTNHSNLPRERLI